MVQHPTMLTTKGQWLPLTFFMMAISRRNSPLSSSDASSGVEKGRGVGVVQATVEGPTHTRWLMWRWLTLQHLNGHKGPWLNRCRAALHSRRYHGGLVHLAKVAICYLLVHDDFMRGYLPLVQGSKGVHIHVGGVKHKLAFTVGVSSNPYHSVLQNVPRSCDSHVAVM